MDSRRGAFVCSCHVAKGKEKLTLQHLATRNVKRPFEIQGKVVNVVNKIVANDNGILFLLTLMQNLQMSWKTPNKTMR